LELALAIFTAAFLIVFGAGAFNRLFSARRFAFALGAGLNRSRLRIRLLSATRTALVSFGSAGVILRVGDAILLTFGQTFLFAVPQALSFAFDCAYAPAGGKPIVITVFVMVALLLLFAPHITLVAPIPLAAPMAFFRAGFNTVTLSGGAAVLPSLFGGPS
jgi:hypothetical protein